MTRGSRSPGAADQASPATVDLGARIRAVMVHLSPVERRIARLMEQDPGRVAQLTAAELAQEASASAATVVRAARSLGYEGYPQLRYALAIEAGRAESPAATEVPPVADVTDRDGVAVIMAKLAAFECSQIMATAELASVSAVEAAATRIARGRRCCVFGIGASGLVAQDFVQKITRIGLNAHVYTEHDAAVMAASLLGPDDSALAISHSGETPGSIEPLRRARESGAYTAAITGNPRSGLAQHADDTMVTAGLELGRRSAAVGSRTSQLLIVDTLFARIGQLTPSTAASLQRTYAAIIATRGRGR